MSRSRSPSGSAKRANASEHLHKPAARTTINVPVEEFDQLKILCVLRHKPYKWGVALAIREFVQRHMSEIRDLVAVATLDPTKTRSTPTFKKPRPSTGRTKVQGDASGSRQELRQAADTSPGLS
jgi:hypothetical protein